MKLDSSAFLADPELIDALEKRSTAISCGGDRVLFRQGDIPQGLYILDLGELTLTMTSPKGEQLIPSRPPPAHCWACRDSSATSPTRSRPSPAMAPASALSPATNSPASCRPARISPSRFFKSSQPRFAPPAAPCQAVRTSLVDWAPTLAGVFLSSLTRLGELRPR